MDSANSESMNSSSGGDDHEYDSRAATTTTADSISALFNPPPPTHDIQIQNPTNPSFNFDDPQPNFFTTNPFLNPNAAASGWSFDPSPPVTAPFQTSPAVNNDQTTKVRNPKKRSRASRRAPTTVLTTDTANFRAMVQEFTGIPASPFSSGPFIRGKLDDFFRGPCTIRSELSAHQSQLPNNTNYQLLKPFPQKLQQPPQFLSSSSFQSLLQSDSKYNPLPGSSGSKSLEVQSGDTTLLKTGLLNEFGFSQTPDISCSGGGDYGSSSQGFSDGRLSFLGSPPSSSLPDYHHTGKESENVVARSEGMMESWICSSSE